MRNLVRFAEVMTYGDFDHPPLMGEGAWPQTLERWHGEGLERSRYWPEVFGVTCFEIAGHGFRDGLYPPFAPRVLEETAECRVFTDESGRTVKDLKTGMTMPEWVDHPVKDRESFRRVLNERFQPCLEQRMPPDYADRVARFNRPDFDALLLPPVGGYWWTLQTLCGVDVAATMLYDCPDLVHELFERMCGFCCCFMERFARDVGPNFVCAGTGEDLAFKNGPFLSPAMYREFLAPRYRKVLALAQRRGVRLCYLDSDGNYDVLLPQMLELGLNIHCPVEVAAGMDPVALRAAYGKDLRLIGGVDKRAVAAGRKAIDQEMERLFPLMCEGGFIPKIDHSVSSDISWDNFRYYMEKLLALHERCANRA
jgi:uroporphyrinogen decarboxylase